jgi:uncharacterized membrane protein
MNDTPVTRDDIHLVSRHSNWPAEEIQAALETNGIYAGKPAWNKFLHFFLLGLGLAFAVAGIIFFFAFNWSSLNKFAKLGLMEGLIAISIAAAVLPTRIDERVKNILLTAASVLVGVLFAVFGQIYQTGADAYDLFLGWTLAILLWTIISGFPVLWLVFLLLCNTTLCLYAEQVAGNWEPPVLMCLLFLLNALFAMVTELAGTKGWTQERSQWLSNLAVTAAVACITIGVCLDILEGSSFLAVSVPLAIAAFVLGIIYGLRHRNLLYLGSIPFAALLILVTFMVKPIDDPIGVFFLAAIVIVGGTTLLIVQLVKLNKRWHEERIGNN